MDDQALLAEIRRSLQVAFWLGFVGGAAFAVAVGVAVHASVWRSL